MKAPKMTVGKELYSVRADDDGKCETRIHVVSSIRKDVVYLIQKNVCTWGKMSKKHYDYGWVRSIDPMWRDKFTVGDDLPVGIRTTKKQAWKEYLKYLRSPWAKSRKAFFDTEKIYQKVLATCKRRSK